MDIILDAGHGGFDNGATYQGRKEKEDVLRLTMAVGEQLERDGYHVLYTRTEDVYNSPYEKAQIANESGADYFISFHRNDSLDDNQYNGVQSLVYQADSEAANIGRNINQQLERVGYNNIGIEERPGLVVLRRTRMPAVLVEAGFINSTVDNQIFDDKFSEMVDAIVRGIEESIPLDTQKNRAMQEERIFDPNMRNREDMDTMPNMRNREDMDMMPNMRNREDMDTMPNMRNREDMDMMPNMRNREDMDMMPNMRNEVDYNSNRMEHKNYAIQTGLFRYRNNALYLANQLRRDGFMPEVTRQEPYFMVYVRSDGNLDDAVRLQNRLRKMNYDTLIIERD